jgi:purine-binding chemotaxis protein CheW
MDFNLERFTEPNDDTNRAINSSLDIKEDPQGELYLKFYLASGRQLALSALGIREVMQQPPSKITSIPNTSPLLLGTMNFRGQIIWVVDLGQFIGESGLLNTDRPEIPIIAVELQEMLLGLAIEKLGPTDWLEAEHLQTYQNEGAAIDAFIQGVWNVEAESKPTNNLHLLDLNAVFESSQWVA